ncbi:MAG TPA: sensor histidine kinase, partial [Nitrospirota bacterium]
FSNLVENAIKYNKPEGTIDINIREENGYAIISVADTGIGIPEDEIGRVFDRFYRVDSSRGQTVGSGLGLSIVGAIVESHGGNIKVESTLGKGSIFSVFLPKDYAFKNQN